MFQPFRFVLFLFLLLSLSACTEPTVDASSSEAFNASIREMTEGLSPGDAVAFRLGVALLISDEGAAFREFIEEGDLGSLKKEIFKGRAVLDGMTYPEVEAELEKMQVAQQKADNQKAEKALQQLKALKKGEGAIASNRVDSVLITAADFNANKRDEFTGREGRSIYLEIQNTLSVPISRIDLSLTLRDANGAVRGHEGMKFRGSVDPEAFRTWQNGLSDLSSWQKLRYQPDDRLDVEISAIYDSEDQLLYRVFTPADELTIEKMEKRLRRSEE